MHYLLLILTFLIISGCAPAPVQYTVKPTEKDSNCWKNHGLYNSKVEAWKATCYRYKLSNNCSCSTKDGKTTQFMSNIVLEHEKNGFNVTDYIAWHGHGFSDIKSTNYWGPTIHNAFSLNEMNYRYNARAAGRHTRETVKDGMSIEQYKYLKEIGYDRNTFKKALESEDYFGKSLSHNWRPGWSEMTFEVFAYKNNLCIKGELCENVKKFGKEYEQKENSLLSKIQSDKDFRLMLFEQGRDYKQGDVICSIDNRAGFAEQITENKIKLLLKIIPLEKAEVNALGKTQPNHYFWFKSGRQSMRVQNVSEYIWDDRDRWSKCGLNL